MFRNLFNFKTKGRNGGKERENPSVDSLPRWPQHPWLDLARLKPGARNSVMVSCTGVKGSMTLTATLSPRVCNGRRLDLGFRLNSGISPLMQEARSLRGVLITVPNASL